MINPQSERTDLAELGFALGVKAAMEYWEPITICVLCFLWFPGALFALYDPHWSYELEAYTPVFPWSVAVPLAIARSSSAVLPFAVSYFCLRLGQVSSDDRIGWYLRGIACVLTILVDLAVLALLSLPTITSALVR
ncbi:hypothetical protein BH09VER1_BH09VER1_48640 [soil metagenome]